MGLIEPDTSMDDWAEQVEERLDSLDCVRGNHGERIEKLEGSTAIVAEKTPWQDEEVFTALMERVGKLEGRFKRWPGEVDAKLAELEDLYKIYGFAKGMMKNGEEAIPVDEEASARVDALVADQYPINASPNHGQLPGLTTEDIERMNDVDELQRIIAERDAEIARLQVMAETLDLPNSKQALDDALVSLLTVEDVDKLERMTEQVREAIMQGFDCTKLAREQTLFVVRDIIPKLRPAEEKPEEVQRMDLGRPVNSLEDARMPQPETVVDEQDGWVAKHDCAAPVAYMHTDDPVPEGEVTIGPSDGSAPTETVTVVGPGPLSDRQASKVLEAIREGRVDSITNGPHCWIQWKGTDVCMDVHCSCGVHGHIDGSFAYTVRCDKCGRRYSVDPNVVLHPLGEEERYGAGTVDLLFDGTEDDGDDRVIKDGQEEPLVIATEREIDASAARIKELEEERDVQDKALILATEALKAFKAELEKLKQEIRTIVAQRDLGIETIAALEKAHREGAPMFQAAPVTEQAFKAQLEAEQVSHARTRERARIDLGNALKWERKKIAELQAEKTALEQAHNEIRTTINAEMTESFDGLEDFCTERGKLTGESWQDFINRLLLAPQLWREWAMQKFWPSNAPDQCPSNDNLRWRIWESHMASHLREDHWLDWAKEELKSADGKVLNDEPASLRGRLGRVLDNREVNRLNARHELGEMKLKLSELSRLYPV